jgi:hypothetical protein
MPIIRRDFNTDLMRWANTIFPFPNTRRYGSKETDLKDIVASSQIQLMEQRHYYAF